MSWLRASFAGVVQSLRNGNLRLISDERWLMIPLDEHPAHGPSFNGPDPRCG